MKILLLGSGGREHALGHGKLPKVRKLKSCTSLRETPEQPP